MLLCLLILHKRQYAFVKRRGKALPLLGNVESNSLGCWVAENEGEKCLGQLQGFPCKLLLYLGVLSVSSVSKSQPEEDAESIDRGYTTNRQRREKCRVNWLNLGVFLLCCPADGQRVCGQQLVLVSTGYPTDSSESSSKKDSPELSSSSNRGRESEDQIIIIFKVLVVNHPCEKRSFLSEKTFARILEALRRARLSKGWVTDK